MPMLYIKLAMLCLPRLIRKSAFSLLFLGLVALSPVGLENSPTGFLPEEDQGFLYVSVQLTLRARWIAPWLLCKQVEDIVLSHAGY